MAKLSIVTSGHFCTSPRVWREADALSNAGHEVTVIGVSYDTRQAELDEQMLRTRRWRYRAAADLRGRSLSSQRRWQWARLRTRWGKMSLKRGWQQDPHALGYGASALLDAALGEKADLTILHLEPALWVGTQLRRQGLAIGVDIEDWYSKNRPEASSQETQYLKRLEGEILRASRHTTTMSRAMATALSTAYDIPMPEVIYNSVPDRVAPAPTPPDAPLRFMWFSQTIGPARGLEDLCAALVHLTGRWTLEIRGHAPHRTRDWLESLIPSNVRGHVQIEPPVPPDRLNAVVTENEVGLALDPPTCPNKDLTVSNKMLQYLQTGLQVVAADTAGVREVRDMMPKAVHLYTAGRVDNLAALMNRMIQQRAAIVGTRDLVFRTANEIFGYDGQAPRLISSVERALQRSR